MKDLSRKTKCHSDVKVPSDSFLEFVIQAECRAFRSNLELCLGRWGKLMYL